MPIENMTQRLPASRQLQKIGTLTTLLFTMAALTIVEEVVLGAITCFSVHRQSINRP